MNIRTGLILAAVLVAGGYLYVDYNSAESKLAREVKEIEQLAPDVKPAECFGKGLNAKLFAVAFERDRRPQSEVDSDTQRKGVIKHDCIRGKDEAVLSRVVKALGPAGVETYRQALQCPVVKDEYPVAACFALDALSMEGSPASIAALEQELTDKEKSRRDVYEGALERLMMRPDWATTAKIADRLPAETNWEAKELMLEYIRNHRDPSAKANLQKAYDAEKDEQEKGGIKAAILEIENPGKCVVTDEGKAASGNCRYNCHDANKWFGFPKPKTGCPLVQEVPLDPAAQAANAAPAMQAAPAVQVQTAGTVPTAK